MKNCVECGELFSPSRISQKYCSKTCATKVERRQQVDRRCEARGRARMVGLCRTCGAEFKKTARAQAFCSETCRQSGKSNVTPYNDINRLKKYGLSEEEYKLLMARADGKCEICKTEEVHAPKGRLHIDHCHETGRVRGLLCQRCNHALGMLGDDPGRLLAAIKYLEQ